MCDLAGGPWARCIALCDERGRSPLECAQPDATRQRRIFVSPPSFVPDGCWPYCNFDHAEAWCVRVALTLEVSKKRNRCCVTCLVDVTTENSPRRRMVW